MLDSGFERRVRSGSMPQQSNPLTLEEHRELARELRMADNRLRELCNVVVGVYGAESRVAFTFLRAAEAVARLRREMQVQAALDWPDAVAERWYV